VRIWRFLNGVENGIAIVAVVVMMLTMMTGWIDELVVEGVGGQQMAFTDLDYPTYLTW